MTQLINRTVHVRFDGRSEELTLAMLDLTSNAPYVPTSTLSGTR